MVVKLDIRHREAPQIHTRDVREGQRCEIDEQSAALSCSVHKGRYLLQASEHSSPEKKENISSMCVFWASEAVRARWYSSQPVVVDYLEALVGRRLRQDMGEQH